MLLLKNKRLWIDAVIFLLAFMAPWWLAFVLASVAAFYFRRYIELVIVGIIIDSLYNGPVFWFAHFPYALTMIALVATISLGYLKTFLRAAS